MNKATLLAKKPIGFRSTLVTMYQLSVPIAYRTQRFTITENGAKQGMAETSYVVISPSINSLHKPVTAVFPVNEIGVCLSWAGIGEKLAGHPPVADVLEKVGYHLT